MLRSAVPLLVSLLLVCAGSAGAQEDAPDSGRDTFQTFSVLLEGYVGASFVERDAGDDDEGFEGGGIGSAVLRLAPVYLQLDVFGDYTDLDQNARNAGVGGHVGLVDPELGSLGVAGAYNNLEVDGFLVDRESDGGRVGAEGELYLDAVSLGLQAGYLDFEDDDAGYYARAVIRYYPLENLKLEGVGGAGDVGDTLGLGRVLVEYRLGDSPLSVFARWEGGFDDDFDQHFAVAGIRLYFDGAETLREADRVYFRDPCIHFPLTARTC